MSVTPRHLRATTGHDPTDPGNHRNTNPAPLKHQPTTSRHAAKPIHFEDHHAEEFKLSQGARLSQGYIRDLGVQRRRYSLALVGLLIASLAAVVIDISTYSPDSSRTSQIVLAYTYNLLASLLVAALISRLVVSLSIREFMARPTTPLAVLGIRASPGLGRVALVLSAIPVPETNLRPDTVESIQQELSVPPQVAISDQVRKGLENLGVYAHSRRDILLTADLTRLMGDAGLDAPLIVSDVEFMTAIAESTSTGRRFRKGIHLQDRSAEPYATHRVTHAVVIGLWSSLVTTSLTESPDIPIRLVDGPDSREIHLRATDTGQTVRVDATIGQRRTENVPHTPSVLARFFFRDISLSIVGGTRGLGTARIGDLLGSRPSTCEELWSTEYSNDLWAGISCPGRGRRGEDFSITAAFNQAGMLRTKRISDVIRWPETSEDEQEG